MRINKIIRNTMIGLSAFIGSSNFTPSSGNFAVKNAEKASAQYTQTIKNVATDTESIMKSYIKPPYRPNYKHLPLYGTTIMVNPGHNVVKENGVFDAGASGKLGKKVIKEMDINAKVAQNTARKFERLGANVIYVEKTRIKDIQALENKIHPDLFIAIHHDAKGLDKHAKNSGETIYAWGPSKKVGGYINKEFKKDETIKNNVGSGISHWASQLCVLKADSTINAVLVEGGFMTNKNELKSLNSAEYQDKEAQMIVDGSRNFFKMIKAKRAQMKKELKIRQEKEFRKSILWFDENKKEGYQVPIYMQPEGRDI